jgi:hypothetical protein
MEIQNQIKRKLSEPESIEYVTSLLCMADDITRTKLAEQLCDKFKFLDFRGEKQLAGCMKALRELEKKKCFVLPAPCHTPGKGNPRRLGVPIAETQGVPDEAGKIEDLRLILVETEEQMRTWNELMIQDHPRGAGPLVGRQLYYLIESEHGWLGGFGFSSSALHLEARDRWIGWDWEIRRGNLHHVVNMSRFLIRSSVSCHNLASRLLGMVVRKLPEDFEKRYGNRILLLESFVDTVHYTGACYRAANWQYVGRTKGYGRQGLLEDKRVSIKDIYVYPLEGDFRIKMGLSEGSGLGAIKISSGICDEEWAENEFGNAPLGDKRLSNRLVEAAADKARQPGNSYCSVAEGDWPKVKGYYRLIDKPDDSEVTMSNILLPHRKRTIQRMKNEEVVLCIQDGSDINYSTLGKCKDLGVIGTNQTGAQSAGLHLHSTYAVTTNGLPLGVLRVECTAPEPKANKDNRPASEIPIEEKKTFCWIEGVRDSMDLKAQMPQTKLVNVMDREADFFELFDSQRCDSPDVDLLVRAKHDRKTRGEHNLFETVRESSVQTRINIKVPRQSARPKKSKQKARAKLPARTAEVSVRYIQTELSVPSNCKDKEAIQIWVVHVREENPPGDAKAVEWFLLTTLNIKSVDDALNCVKWYCLRWRIEDWHRVLKFGCGIKKIAHKTAERLKRAIAINMVIAWRIMLMTLLGRETPELPAEVLFSDIEIQVLEAYAKKKGLMLPNCLGTAVKLVAKIGGYLGRSGDHSPGHQLMWNGYSKLQLMCEGFTLKNGFT